ncbi:uncharacterized protein LOC126997367 [Eriocheir sinensis]|uniref:uncharacterized protein LOC126997367 n=1 Tax=Eriocheir sinensis TaxID=95602 RepID=UPI0021C65E54|nr:uncharacterized protein LOC126997367 [Eriocheir sinensis]
MASGTGDSEEIYGNNDTILLYKLGLTGKLLGALQKPGGYDDGHDSHEEETEYDEGAYDGHEEETEYDEVDYDGHEEETEYDDYYDSFSSGEEEIEDTNQQEIAPTEEENTQQVQDENIQGNDCDEEDGYLVLRPSSPEGINSQTPSSLPVWPPMPQPPSNITRQLSQRRGVPWKPHPTSKEINSAANSVFSNPQNNGRSPGPSFADLSNRGPMPVPAQKRDFQNKVCPETPDRSARPLPKPDKLGLSKVTPKGPTETEGSTVRPSRFGHQRQSLRVPQENCGAKNGAPPIINHQTNNQPDTLAQQRQLQNSVNARTNVPVKGSPTRYGPSPQNSNNCLGSPKLPLPSSTPFVKLENGEKITLTPLYRSIIDKPYFHLVSRDFAKNLTTTGGAGAFLIRPSRKTGNPLTITVNNGRNNFHVSIRRRPDNLFALGSERREEMTFSTIDEIIDTHQQTPIVLSNGTRLTLKHSPIRTGNTYVQHSVPGSRGNRN